jgi:prepilin-type N-terminal cleavage/methylation domain-containing protein
MFGVFDKVNLKSFTLVELLIVIAILAVLAAAVVIVLNPAELLSQARDGQRSSDIKMMGDALTLFVTDNPSLSIGTYKKVYISIPDSSVDCSGISNLPDLPAGWTYNCTTSENLNNADGTGWIPIDFTTVKGGSPIPHLPIDPKNTIDFFYSYIPSAYPQYAISASVESVKQKQTVQSGVFATKIAGGSLPQLASIPQGGDWIRVPGNSDYETEDFWAMKYEAKCVGADGQALLSPDTGEMKTYNNEINPCIASSDRYISSTKSGYPIGNINHDTAKAYCESIGTHLITNEEWMTIARNAEQVNSNWSGGSPGEGYFYSGHNDYNPHGSLQASLDADGYAGTNNTSGNQRRTLTLSNGEVIWDLSGNVFEHVMRTPADLQTLIATPSCNTGTGGQWCEHGTTTSPYISEWTADVTQSNTGPSNETDWNSLQGMGKLYTVGGMANKINFFRGGASSNYSSAGIYNMVFVGGPDNAIDYVGFRCAK